MEGEYLSFFAPKKKDFDLNHSNGMGFTNIPLTIDMLILFP
jgi:hypothetical protein